MKTPKKTPHMKTLWDKHMKELPKILGDLRGKANTLEKRRERARTMAEAYSEDKTLREIGDEHGISYERVRQLIEWYMETQV